MSIGKQVDIQEIEAEEVAKKTSMSKGEKLFDLFTYAGISGVGVFLLGIPITYWAKYGRGANMFKNSAKWLEGKGMSPKLAEDVVMTTVLMQPGNIAVAPVLLSENHKEEMVEYFNKLTGDKSHDASIEGDSKQSWGSLGKARIVAWLSAFAGFRGGAMLFGKQMEAFEHTFAEAVCHVAGKPTHTPGLAKIVENESKLFRYGKVSALDVFATAAATTILYFGSRVFARKNSQWHAQHTHVLPEPDASKPLETATLTEPSRLFADSISLKSRAILASARPSSYTQSVTASKFTPGLGA